MSPVEDFEEKLSRGAFAREDRPLSTDVELSPPELSLLVEMLAPPELEELLLEDDPPAEDDVSDEVGAEDSGGIDSVGADASAPVRSDWA